MPDRLDPMGRPSICWYMVELNWKYMFLRIVDGKFWMSFLVRPFRLVLILFVMSPMASLTEMNVYREATSKLNRYGRCLLND